VHWDCPSCGHANDGVAVCDACGIARRFFDDPPLDIPRRPRWAEVGASYAAGGYGVLALAGAGLLLAPGLRESLGLGSDWIALEVALTGAAAAGSGVHAAWSRTFHRSDLSLPRAVRAGQEFEAVLELVPFDGVERVWVTIELVDRWYETGRHRGRQRVRTRSRVLERWRLHDGAPLTGRRRHQFRVTFAAPPPSERHSNVQAEVLASILGVFGPLVPGLSHHARNLRQHGGYYVRARVRAGPWRRSFEQQVVSVAVPLGIAAA
jgi:hypothetical protein